MASEERLKGLESEFEKMEEGRERVRSSGLVVGEDGVEAERPMGTDRWFADTRRRELGGEEGARLEEGRCREGEGDDA